MLKQFRDLIAQLDLENYTPPSQDQQITAVLGQAQSQVQQALDNPAINRLALAQALEQAIQHYAAQGPEAPGYVLVQQFRDLIAQLDLENYTPPSQDQQITAVLGQAQSQVQQALENPAINRLTMAQELEKAAHYYAEGEEEGAPYYLLAQQLRDLIAQLDLENYTPPSLRQKITYLIGKFWRNISKQKRNV
jgi:hypothetical protein